ncbi:fumarylacetoacetate hydrolase family protein [Streptomyces sp. bgisy027]|uniref:fumarylacetoacetate hydrolase family protein n=1 Tax=Streptomyces sp. bgisy027 TaxID=3413770 RepID=UPI003D70E283
MRYATFEVNTPVGPIRRIGVVTAAGRLLDLNQGYAHVLVDRVDRSRARVMANVVVPPDLIALMAGGTVSEAAIAETLEALGPVTDDPEAESALGGRLVYSADEVQLLSPLPRPASLRDCSAFEQHVSTASRGNVPPEWYEMPVYYKGNPNAVVGTGTDVTVPTGVDRLDYELEYAVVIGRSGSDIAEEDAVAYIAGYTVFNDISERRAQLKEMRAGLGPAKGKDADGTNVLGPYLVTADEWDPDKPHAMIARVAGEEWSRGSTDTIHYSVAQIVSHISRRETLHVGDVIGTGTVGGGCGLELRRYPQPGDLVELEVEGLGVLGNRWIAEDGA